MLYRETAIQAWANANLFESPLSRHRALLVRNIKGNIAVSGFPRIDRGYSLIDQKFGHHARFLTAAGLRLDDARSAVHTLSEQGEISVGQRNRAFFIYSMDGKIIIKRKGYDDFALETGFAAGLEHGEEILIRNTKGSSGKRVIVSSIGQQHAFIRQLPEGLLIVAPDERPYADLIAASVLILETALKFDPGDIAVTRRACEIIMLQLMRFVQHRLITAGNAPGAIRHDPHLLRSWSAFHSNPSRKWTLPELAEASGLSRSAYIVRFKKAFGAPPQEVITRMRLEQGKYLLHSSTASLAEIATDIGYASDAAFIRAFAREYGTTPGEWRGLKA